VLNGPYDRTAGIERVEERRAAPATRETDRRNMAVGAIEGVGGRRIEAGEHTLREREMSSSRIDLSKKPPDGRFLEEEGSDRKR